jgi:hypothetical protein
VEGKTDFYARLDALEAKLCNMREVIIEHPDYDKSINDIMQGKLKNNFDKGKDDNGSIPPSPKPPKTGLSL